MFPFLKQSLVFFSYKHLATLELPLWFAIYTLTWIRNPVKLFLKARLIIVFILSPSPFLQAAAPAAAAAGIDW